MSWHLVLGLCLLSLPFWFTVCGFLYVFVRNDDALIPASYTLTVITNITIIATKLIFFFQ